MNSRAIITLYQGYDNEIDEYLGDLLSRKTLNSRLVFCYTPLHFSYFFLVNKMYKVPQVERKERLARKKNECQLEDNLKIRPGGPIAREGKGHDKDHTLGSCPT